MNETSLPLYFPVLYHKGKKGAIYRWNVWADGPNIYTRYGQLDGLMQESCKLAEMKNVGRFNQTTPAQQARIEAKAMWIYKVERKYRENLDDVMKRKNLPMLAPNDEFSKTKRWVHYPCYVQPKLDGLRCLAYWEGDRILMMSRSGKPFNLPHIEKVLKAILPEDAMFDGELYVHGQGFQTLSSWIKRSQEDTKRIQYHVYDVPIWEGEEMTWDDRYTNLLQILQSGPFPPVYVIRTYMASQEQEIIQLHDHFVAEGYEGAMVRIGTGRYEWGYRSHSLLKCKAFEDHEYEVVGFTNGKGKNANTVTWRCRMKDGKEFDVSPMGTKKDRAQMLIDGNDYIGKMLKVKHQKYTDKGLPRIPTGIGFREGNE